MVIIFSRKKSMGTALTDEWITFIIERSNVKLLLHDVEWNISQIFITILRRLAFILNLLYVCIIDLLKTFSYKREVIFKCDTKCFKNLKDIAQYSAPNTTIF